MVSRTGRDPTKVRNSTPPRPHGMPRPGPIWGTTGPPHHQPGAGRPVGSAGFSVSAIPLPAGLSGRGFWAATGCQSSTRVSPLATKKQRQRDLEDSQSPRATGDRSMDRVEGTRIVFRFSSGVRFSCGAASWTTGASSGGCALPRPRGGSAHHGRRGALSGADPRRPELEASVRCVSRRSRGASSRCCREPCPPEGARQCG